MSEKVQARDGDKERILQRERNLGGRDTHAIRPDANAALFGFSAGGDDDFDGRGAHGGRGRGGRDQAPREPRQGGRKGRGGKIVVDDDAFPAL